MTISQGLNIGLDTNVSVILSRNKHDISEATKAFPDVKRSKSAEEPGIKNTKAQRKRIYR